jgi:hypothetical protein
MSAIEQRYHQFSIVGYVINRLRKLTILRVR